jgi:hypothetical protein
MYFLTRQKYLTKRMMPLNVREVDAGEFCVKLPIRSKFDGFEWIFMAVYGAAQDIQKQPFLAELVRMCENQTLPMLTSIVPARCCEQTIIVYLTLKICLHGRCFSSSCRAKGHAIESGFR